jgi:hypothetical protein
MQYQSEMGLLLYFCGGNITKAKGQESHLQFPYGNLLAVREDNSNGRKRKLIKW